jgi:uncharacterized lipoprotein YmbA
MNRAIMRIAGPALVLVALAGLSGCSSTAPPRFYTLSSTRQAASADTASDTGVREAALATLLVGAVEIPQTLDRPQLVRRSGVNRIDVAEYDRWSEPLDAMIRRTLAEDLGMLLPKSRILTSTLPAVPVDQTLVVEIARFEADNAGMVTLEAQWFVLAERDSVPRLSRRATITEPADSGESEAVVAAMSGALAKFAGEVANALTAAPPTPRRPSRAG